MNTHRHSPTTRGDPKRPRSTSRLRRLLPWGWLAVALVGEPATGAEAVAPSRADWSRTQTIDLAAPGVYRVAVPASTLHVARPGLEDLRLIGPRGNEVPYGMFTEPFVDPEGNRRVAPRRFLARLEPGSTVLTLETGVTNEVGSVTVQTTARDFIKAVRVEGSRDGESWIALADGVPLFRQAGATRLTAEFAPGAWPWLRLTVDDTRSAPVGFTDATLRFKAPASPAVTLPVVVEQRTETHRHTRLAVRLPAPNLRVAAVVIGTPEPLFLRAVTVLERRTTERATNEFVLGAGEIHRLDLEGMPRSTNLAIPVERAVATDRIEIDVANEDNPALALDSVSVRVRPTYLVFRTGEAGRFELWSGNATCPAPRYDVGGLLGAGLAAIPESGLSLGPVTTNASYRVPAPLPGVPERAARFELEGWRYRKPVAIRAPGIQLLELDPEAVARARSDLADLRVLQGPEPVPFLVADGPRGRATILPRVERSPDPREPRRSRWRLTLPHAGLPVDRLACSSPTTLFRRSMTLSELARDDRGFERRRHLGSAEWEARVGAPADSLALVISGRPETDTLWLETEDGDNPPMELTGFALGCDLPRLRFKLTGSTEDVWLVFGNADAVAPDYDLRLARDEVNAAPAHPATLGAMETRSGNAWSDFMADPGSGGPLFWAVLVLVAGTLLWVILRFLPKAEA